MTIKYITPTPPTKAEGVAAEVYGAMKEDFMFAEPVSLHAPSPQLLSAFWSVFRDVMVGEGLSDRWDREVVAGAVSAANDCHFCMVTHAAMEKASPPPSGPRDREGLVRWAQAVMTGEQSNAPGLSAEQSDELRGVVVLFQYLNRMVSTFMEKASPFDPPADGRELTDAEQKMRGQIMAMVRQQMAKTVSKSGATDPASVITRIKAGLTEPDVVRSGAVQLFHAMVAKQPSEITESDAAQAKTEVGGDKALLETAAYAALSAAVATAGH